MTGRGLAAALAFLWTACAGAGWGRSAPPPQSAEAMRDEYMRYLDAGRTAGRVVEFTVEAGDFRVIDLLSAEPAPLEPGDRIAFVAGDRAVIFAVIGQSPVEDGVRLISAHIDTPSLRLDTSTLTQKGQTQIPAYTYGGVRGHQWLFRPLALVGEVAASGGRRVSVELGLTDDYSLMALEQKGGAFVITTSSTPTEDGVHGPATTFVGELNRRYQLRADDLTTAELFLVPRERARVVGLDRSLIGGHGQDDRVNGYVAWRAITALRGTPSRTAMVWLVDREEVGSTGWVGARARLLEMALAYLARARGGRATEAVLHRALARSQAISADTPACTNPNFPGVHEASSGPIIGSGPVMFPVSIGRGGRRGHASHAGLVRSVLSEFESASAAFQVGAIGKVDQGGGSSVAQYLSDRGMDVVDLGVCVISMHSPFELSAAGDLWHAFIGFSKWLAR